MMIAIAHLFIFLSLIIKPSKQVSQLDLKDHSLGELKTDAQLLDNILDGVNYNGMLRPQHNKKQPLQVFVSLFVTSLSDINLITQSFIVQMNLKFRWQDDRLAFSIREGHIRGTNIIKNGIPVDDISFTRLWLPGAFFPNEKEAKIHDITTKNKRAWIFNDGRVICDIWGGSGNYAFSTYARKNVRFYFQFPDISSCYQAADGSIKSVFTSKFFMTCNKKYAPARVNLMINN